MRVKHRIENLRERKDMLRDNISRTVPMLGIDVYTEEEQEKMWAEIRKIEDELLDIKQRTGMF